MDNANFQKAKELDVRINQIGDLLFILRGPLPRGHHLMLTEYGTNFNDKITGLCRCLQPADIAIIIKALEDERDRLENEFNNL